MFAEQAVDLGQIEGLFKEVKYYVTGNISNNVQKALSAGEAKKTAYLSGINTHCIVGYEPDMNEVSEATDMLDVPSVDQDWVIASAQAKHLLPIKPFSPAEGRLFMGVTACVSDVSPSDMAKLWAMLSWHGGKVTKEMSPRVTHLIINKPLGDLYNNTLPRPGVKIVTSTWVLETVKGKSKLNEDLFHPRLLLIPENKPKEKPKPKPKPIQQPPPKPMPVQQQPPKPSPVLTQQMTPPVKLTPIQTPVTPQPQVQSVQVTGRPPVQTPTAPIPGVHPAQPAVSTMPASSPAATSSANPTIQSAVSSLSSTQPTAVSTPGQPQQLQQQQQQQQQLKLQQQKQQLILQQQKESLYRKQSKMWYLMERLKVDQIEN